MAVVNYSTAQGFFEFRNYLSQTQGGLSTSAAT
jgi:hypothetical protein